MGGNCQAKSFRGQRRVDFPVALHMCPAQEFIFRLFYWQRSLWKATEQSHCFGRQGRVDFWVALHKCSTHELIFQYWAAAEIKFVNDPFLIPRERMEREAREGGVQAAPCQGTTWS